MDETFSRGADTRACRVETCLDAFRGRVRNAPVDLLLFQPIEARLQFVVFLLQFEETGP